MSDGEIPHDQQLGTDFKAMKNLESEERELSEFFAELAKESDLGAALVAASLLDEQLHDILRAFLATVSVSDDLLAGFNAPLGTFSARIAAAYSLGLIQENEYRELNLIRRIRNEFAHRWKDVSFETEKIAHLCSELPWLGPAEFEEGASTRSRFSFAVSILLVDLMWRARLVEQEKRAVRIWSHKSRKG